MIADYRAAAADRAKHGVPPLPLTAQQTSEVCALLEQPRPSTSALTSLLTLTASPGASTPRRVEPPWLGAVAVARRARQRSPPRGHLPCSGTMLGGYNIPSWCASWRGPTARAAVKALSPTILIFDNFTVVAKLAEGGNAHAKAVIQGWADGVWFTSRPAMPTVFTGVVAKVPGETNTDDLSPAQQASAAPVLHAPRPGHVRGPRPAAEAGCAGSSSACWLQAGGKGVIIAGDVHGPGSSRKSATNSVMWATGTDIPFIPNKRSGAVVLGSIIAPIFLDTFRDASGLPVVVDVPAPSRMATRSRSSRSRASRRAGEVVAKVQPALALDPRQYRAGGLQPDRRLTLRAREHLKLKESTLFTKPVLGGPQKTGLRWRRRSSGAPAAWPGSIRRLPNSKMTTVGSQDTTGPMTADELKELACLRFSADLVLRCLLPLRPIPRMSTPGCTAGCPSSSSSATASPCVPGTASSTAGSTAPPACRTRSAPARTAIPATSASASRLGAGGLRRGDRLHAAGHTRRSVLVRFTGKLQLRHHPARPGQRHPPGWRSRAAI